MPTLGAMIQARRKELRLSQEKLAEKIGKTAGYVGQIERGISQPSYPTLQRLVEVLELDVQSLFGPGEPAGASQRMKNEYSQIFARLSLKQQQLALGVLRVIARNEF